MLYRYANGLDSEPVKSIYEKEKVKSVGNGMTFRQDLVGEEDVRSGICTFGQCCGTFTPKNMKCTTVQILIKDPQFKSISRQKKLEKPTYVSRDIRNAAMELVKKSWNLKLPIRMMSVTGTNLVGENDVYEQMSLIEDNTENTKK